MIKSYCIPGWHLLSVDNTKSNMLAYIHFILGDLLCSYLTSLKCM